MILECTSCATRFLVPDAALQGGGRKVRCGGCGHVWFQEPPQNEATAASIDDDQAAGDPMAASAAAAMPAASAASPDGEAGDAQAAALAAEATARLPAVHRFGPPGWVPWAAAAMLLLMVGAVLYAARTTIVEQWPTTRRVYAAVGLMSANPWAGLEIRELRSTWRDTPDGTILVIEGDLINIGEGGRDAPHIRVALHSANDQELASWTFRATDRRILPNEIVSFQTTVPAPPPAASDAFLTFVGDHAS